MILVADISLWDVTMLFMLSQYQGKNRWLNTSKGIKMLQLFVHETFASPELHVYTKWASEMP